MISEEKNTLNRVAEMNEKEKVEFLQKVQGRKKGGQPAEFKQTFKPGGPQDYND